MLKHAAFHVSQEAFIPRRAQSTHYPIDKTVNFPSCPARNIFIKLVYHFWTASVVLWSEFLATDPEVLGSTLGPVTFSEK
jgi:hypothetical protein